MKQISEKWIRAEASRGKNEPIARSTRMHQTQNAEVAPTRSTARKQPGTDEASARRR